MDFPAWCFCPRWDTLNRESVFWSGDPLVLALSVFSLISYAAFPLPVLLPFFSPTV